MSTITTKKGDCLELMKDISDGSIDMILTDPPYGTTACKWDSVIPFEPMWEQLNRVIKPNGAIVLFGSEPFSSALRMSNIKNYKYDWIWDKGKGTDFLNAKVKPLSSYENISVFYNKKPMYNPQFWYSTPYDRGMTNLRNVQCYGKAKDCYGKSVDGKRYPLNVIKLTNCNQKAKVHPTQKPVALLEYLIKTYTNENETVLDFTAGSGSTGVACINTNRNFIGIELDENYYNIADKRLLEAMVKKGNEDD